MKDTRPLDWDSGATVLGAIDVPRKGCMDEPEAKHLMRIEGQIAAIGMALRTLIESHSNPKALRNRVQAQCELLQSSLRSRDASDDVKEGAHLFVNRWIQKGDEQPKLGSVG